MSQEPVTPPKVFRPQPRYPSHLSRKKSDEIRTYEPLEDLLRAAGYKETRIFTPEAERIDTPKEAEGVLEKPLATVKDGVAAVAGFLANLIPSAAGADKTATTRLADGLATERPRTSAGVLRAYSPPPSPLARLRPGQQPPRKEATRNTIDLSEPPTPTTTVSSLQSFGDPTPRASRYYAGGGNVMPPSTATASFMATNSMPPPPLPHRTSQHLPPRSSSYLSAQTSSGQMSKQSSHTSLRQQAYANTLEIVSPHPSQAARRLRHMASTQSIEVPPRPSSTPVAHYANSRRPATTVRVSDTESSEGTEATYVPAPAQYHQHQHHHHYPHPHPPSRLSSASHLRPVPARQSVLDTLRQGFPDEANGRLPVPVSSPSPLSKSSSSMSTSRPNFLSTDPYGFTGQQQQHHVYQYHQSGSAGYGQAPRSQTLRATRSSLSQTSSRAGGSRRSYTQQQQQPKIRSGLSDQTNVTTTTPNTSTTSLASSGKGSTGGSFLMPPLPHPLLVFSAHPERGRALRCEGEVTKTRVVCRSAPGSRASSIKPTSERRVFLGGLSGGMGGGTSVGGNARGRRSTGGGGGKRRKGGRSGYGSGKGGDEDGVSSLTLTEQLLEGDVPVGEEIEEEESRRLRKAKAASRKRYLGGWMLAGSQADDEDSQEDDDDEVTLDTLMVPPPKRQQSIKSLRRHLDGQGLRRPQSVGPAPDRASGFSFRFVGGSSNKEDLEEALFSDDWIRGGGARRRHSEEGDDEEFSAAGWFGHDVEYGRERSGRGKSRLSSALGFRGGS